MTFAREFAEKSNLPREFGARVETAADGSEVLLLSEPAAVARFVAFVKYRIQHYKGNVFLRGQASHHAGLVPSLFRTLPALHYAASHRAYQEMIQALSTALGYDRFRRGQPGALYQHYGFRTPWVDLVDNLYTALWFATHVHVQANGKSCYRVAEADHGYLLLVADRLETGEMLRLINLRQHHSSMCVRLHVQHAFSVSSQEDEEELQETDYGRFVVARVRIPNTSRFRLRGISRRRGFCFRNRF